MYMYIGRYRTVDTYNTGAIIKAPITITRVGTYLYT